MSPHTCQNDYYQKNYFKDQPGAAIQNVRSVKVLKNIDIIQAEITEILFDEDKVCGVVTSLGTKWTAEIRISNYSQ